MENTEFNVVPSLTESGELAKNFMAKVFTWMAAALFISGITAWMFGTSSLITLLVGETGMTPLGYVVLFAPLGFVLLMSFGFNRLSAPLLILCFLVYSILTGMSLSFIFLVYTAGSIYSIFAIAGGMFGVMAIAGYTTNTDLTKFGSLMVMALFGLVIATVINAFMHSEQFSYILSFVGVLVFTGLTAYDVQKLKRIGSGAEYGTENTQKLAILGALSLYLDFVNLFLYLLRLFGRRR